MHRRFAAASKDPAFAPEPVSEDDLQSWTATAQAMERQAFEGLAERGTLEPARAAASRPCIPASGAGVAP